MTTRFLNPTPAAGIPKNSIEWHRLMTQAIARAEAGGSKRVQILRQALASGQIEQTLRRMGIISVVDIEREFPKKT